MTFLNPLALAFAALAIPIILLYMLRLRRQELVVSSHFLWRRALKDYAANTPWQRLRRNVLLLLQLLILALLVVALARPVLPSDAPQLGRAVVLLDASASMQALEADGQTRWRLAAAQARRLVDELGVGDEMLLLQVGQTIDLLSDFTADRTRLLSAIDSAQPGFGTADWETALTTAAAAASAQPDTRIFIISDGSGGDLAQVVLPAAVAQPTFIPVGERSDNVAITTLAVRAHSDDNWQVFAQIVNYGAQPVTLAITLRLDGVLWRSQEASLEPQSQRSVTFAIDQPFETVQAALVVPPAFDALAIDNTAFAVAPRDQTRRVLLVSAAPMSFLERALRVLPGVRLVQGDPSRPLLPAEQYDAYVFEGYLPSVLPEGDLLIVNPPRSTPLFQISADGSLPIPRGVVVVQPDHPLLPFVDLSALNLRELRIVDSELLRPIVTMGGEALLLAGERGAQQIALLPFDLSDSDLPLQLAFPILMANLLEWFTPQTQLVASDSLMVGEALSLSAPLAAASLRVVDPQGVALDVPLGVPFIPDRPGLYRVEAYRGEVALARQWVAVNVFDRESDIAPVEGIILSGTPISVEEEQARGLRDATGWVVLLALALLLLEWRAYHQQAQPRRA